MKKLGSILKKRSEETGREEVTIENKPAEKTSLKGLGGALKKHKADKALKQKVKADAVAREMEAPDVGVAFERGLVPHWSYSTLNAFETCPYRVQLQKIDKLPQLDPEPDVGMDRGNKIHDHLEHYVKGLHDELNPKLSGKPWKAELFKADLDWLRDMFQKGHVSCEDNWGIRDDWSPCEWSDPELWGRGKLDAFVIEGTSCRIIDYKSGRQFGNEIKHSDQGLSYGLHALNRFPELTHFQIEFWYLDQAGQNKMIKRYSRDQLQLYLNRYHKRAVKMTSATKFPAVPTESNCRFCPYGNGKFGTGGCKKAV